MTVRVFLKDYPTVYAEKAFKVEVGVDCAGDSVFIDPESEVFEKPEDPTLKKEFYLGNTPSISWNDSIM